MLYVFTSTEDVVKPEDLKVAVHNMGIEDARRLPIPHNEFWSESQIFDNMRTRFSKFCMISGHDYYTFTMKSTEFDMIRVLVKQRVITCGVNVIIFGAGGEILGECGVDENGMSDVFYEYKVFRMNEELLGALFSGRL